MASGAGDASAHRRRDLRSGLLLFTLLLFSFFSFNLPKNPNLSDRPLWNGEREKCFIISLYQTSSTDLSLNRATELLHQPNDILGQTSEQYLDDTSKDSRSGLTMDVVKIPLPPPSTLTPAPPSPARRSMPSTLTPAHGVHVFFVLILEPSDESSTIKMVSFLTQTSENSRFAPNDQRSAPRFATVYISDHESLISSRQNHGCRLILKLYMSPPCSLMEWSDALTPVPMMVLMKEGLKLAPSSPSKACPYIRSGLTLTSQTEQNLGFLFMGLINYSGPICMSKPKYKSPDQAHLALNIRSVFNNLHNLLSSILRFFNMSGRSLHSYRDWMLMIWFCDDLSYTLMTMGARQPPIHLAGISDDILALARTSRDLSFRFLPRSHNLIVDDLSKTAVRSMTIGPSIIM